MNLTEEILIDLAKFLLHYDQNMSREQTEHFVNLANQILEDHKIVDELMKYAEIGEKFNPKLLKVFDKDPENKMNWINWNLFARNVVRTATGKELHVKHSQEMV